VIKKIEHIGIAVKDLKKSEELFEKLLGENHTKPRRLSQKGLPLLFLK